MTYHYLDLTNMTL